MKTKLNVLLIDDDDADRMAVARALRKASFPFEVEEAVTGREGIERYAETHHDCVLLDYHLPDIDGGRVLEEIVKRNGSTTTVIVLTGQGTEELALDVMEGGAVDYLNKRDLTPTTLGRAILHGQARQHFRRTQQELLQQLQTANESLQAANERLEREVNAREQAEAAERKTNAALTTANRELETFCYTISHDLRAHLRAIDGYARVLEEDCGPTLDETGHRCVGKITESSERMDALITRLLQMSRVVRGDLEISSVDLSKLANNALEEFSQQCNGRSIEFDVADGLLAAGDESLLYAVVQNLLSNAIKFTADTDRPRIEFGCEELPDGEVAFFVRDNGIGFDPAFAEQITTPFARAVNAAGYEGSGIGMATVARVIERHGGRLWADGRPNGGATIRFTLGSRLPETARVAAGG